MFLLQVCCQCLCQDTVTLRRVCAATLRTSRATTRTGRGGGDPPRPRTPAREETTPRGWVRVPWLNSYSLAHGRSGKRDTCGAVETLTCDWQVTTCTWRRRPCCPVRGCVCCLDLWGAPRGRSACTSTTTCTAQGRVSWASASARMERRRCCGSWAASRASLGWGPQWSTTATASIRQEYNKTSSRKACVLWDSYSSCLMYFFIWFYHKFKVWD